MGPVGDLGHAPQPRLLREGGFRQDTGRPRARRAEPHRPPRRPHRPPAGQDARQAQGGIGRIPVPALVDEETFDRVQQRLQDNKRFAPRNAKVPSLLQGLAACSSCGYGYYRTSTTTSSGKKIYYYRCLGSDDYRYQGGRVCGNKPVRATTPMRSSGTTSPPCSPTPYSSAPRSAKGWSGRAPPTRSPASAASSSRPSPRPASRSPR